MLGGWTRQTAGIRYWDLQTGRAGIALREGGMGLNASKARREREGAITGVYREAGIIVEITAHTLLSAALGTVIGRRACGGRGLAARRRRSRRREAEEAKEQQAIKSRVAGTTGAPSRATAAPPITDCFWLPIRRPSLGAPCAPAVCKAPKARGRACISSLEFHQPSAHSPPLPPRPPSATLHPSDGPRAPGARQAAPARWRTRRRRARTQARHRRRRHIHT